MRFSLRTHSVLFVIALLLSTTASADAIRQTKGDYYDAFRQLDVDLPTPNVYRTASGAPGSQYWQQRASHKIKVELDEAARRINGSETIEYINNSPDSLRYIWLQLDQNRFRNDSLERRSETAVDIGGRRNLADQSAGDVINFAAISRNQAYADTLYGYELKKVVDSKGKPLHYKVIDTMMRIDLPQTLRSGQKTTFSIDWAFNIVNEVPVSARGGYEHFADNDTYIFFLAQWFPRLAAYTDYAGWQHKAFLGRGEFTLEFGDYEVEITVPADHVVSATGALQNASQVLTSEQQKRLKQAETAKTPVFIVTPEEAADNEKEGTSKKKTWIFKADNVRDFAWASSRKFIWDAMGHRQESSSRPFVMAMSFYPNEAEPIWSKYSTQAVLHTMDIYSSFSFAYPYPTAQSVNTWKRGGMEYPMITFNGYRADDTDPETTVDGAPARAYSRATKYGLIGVIIHEIGHIYFPMTVNSDERQWTWMDEGINSFLDYVSAIAWEENFPSYGDNVNVLDSITEYMVSENQVPIMTQSDSIIQFGPNAYSKPTAALIVLRETVMGRELFDFAFKEYATRWKFKRPTPSDFFRTMEDASGVDLDWFWRGWFYSTDHVDVSIANVREYKISSENPEIEFPLNRAEVAAEIPEPLQQSRNREEGRKTRLDRYPELADFYNENDRFTVTNQDRNDYAEMLAGLEDSERTALDRAIKEDQFIYFVDFENLGGLPTPMPLLITYADGTQESMMIPAEIWRRNYKAVTKSFFRDQPIVSFEIDHQHQIADADFSNNHYPRKIEKSRLEIFKDDEKKRNLMEGYFTRLLDAKDGVDKESKEVPLTPLDHKD